MSEFRNEPLAELRRAWVRDGLAEALAALDAELPLRVPVIVGESRRGDPAPLQSTDPGAPNRVVATAAVATPEEVGAAVRAARAAQPAWAALGAERRAEILSRAAALLRERKPRLTALAVRECAKPWDQADGDVCEAIDFLEYYARAAVALDRGEALVQLPGERNALAYRARGVVAVIAPWNFPVAIPCGMTAAALATGNAALLKPAEQSPACGGELVRALLDAGVPPGVLALLPGEGEVGAALAEHPGVHVIAFTGSGAVGQEIIETAARLSPGQDHVKHVVAEMGGKNAIIVDRDADLDDAVPAIAYSAFGFAGQKCSACDLVLVDQAIAPALNERLAGLLDTLVVDQASRFGVDVPPVIERAAQERLERVISRTDDRDGWFVAPTVLTDVPVAPEEFFGPVVVVNAVSGIDEALAVMNDLPYGLTGGLFSRNPDTVRDVIARVPVGNFYVNRHITGAMVGRQPFGGNRLSGTGTKAGGPGYLHHFVESFVVSENTMRHGLVAS